MDSNTKKKNMLGLIFICVGLFGIMFCLVFPTTSNPIIFMLSMGYNIIIFILGIIFLYYGLAGKVPTPQITPAPIVGFFIFGTIHLVLFFLYTLESTSIAFVNGLLFYAIGGYYLWLYLKERQTKSS